MLSWFKMGKPGPTIISCLVVTGFMGVLVLLILKPLQIDTQIGDILKILIGSLGAKFGDVVQYHIGSSAGSRDKDGMMHQLAANAVANSTPNKDS